LWLSTNTRGIDDKELCFRSEKQLLLIHGKMM
jgi:hypothetical protein